MGRIKCGAYCNSGFAKKRDTPVKRALSGRHKHRRLLSNKHFETLKEESKMEETTVKPSSAALTSGKAVQSKTVCYLRSPAHTKSTRHTKSGSKKNGHKVSPVSHTSLQVNHKSEAFKGCEFSALEETPIKDEEQSLTVTPESTISSTTESDTTLSFDQDKEYGHSSTSLSTSSLSSPEIFRKEDNVEMLTSPSKEELLGVSLQIKNSTLLDVSHAETIQMHHTPNISSIVNASMMLTEINSEDRSNYRGFENKAQIQTEPFKSANQAQVFKRRIPVMITNKRPILFKKKVSFKNPIIAEVPEAKHVPVINLTVNDVSNMVQKSSPAEQMKPDEETPRADEINSEDSTVHMRVTLKKPVKSNPEKAKFFDFASESDRDLFFRRVRERHVKLRCIPLFPLTAPESTETSFL